MAKEEVPFHYGLFVRVGRGTRLPPQFGHTNCRLFFAHSKQNVHSNEQIWAPSLSGASALEQLSHLGFISSMASWD